MGTHKNFYIVILVLLFGCNRSQPAPLELVGTWVGDKGGELVIDDNGCIRARNFPRSLLIRDSGSVKINGTGSWTLETGRAAPKLRVIFDAIGDLRKFEAAVEVHGIGRDMRLLFWEDEPGGTRFEFSKKMP